MHMMRAAAAVLRTCLVLAVSDIARAKNNASKQFLQQLLQGMDPRIRPPSEDNGPVIVKVNFHVVSFSSISEVNMDFKTDIYFRESWKDPRLVYSGGPPSISLPSRFVDQIWTPDLYFPNEKEAKFHDVTMPNKLLKLFPDGTVIFSVSGQHSRCDLCEDETTINADSDIILSDGTIVIPLGHSDMCHQDAYETHELQLVWRDPPIEIDEELELPQFELVEINNVTCQKQYKTTGSFPCLKATFTLYRHFGFFLLQTYIPSALIIILSWVSFWINMDAVPARISLGVTTVLTMTTQLSGSKGSIPKVSYPKAIDIWMSMGMLFVFAALVEYAFVNAISRKHTKQELYKKREKQQDMMEGPETNNPPLDGSSSANFEEKRGDRVNYRRLAHNIDKVSRYVFPTVFLLFNLIYWPIYSVKRVQ